MTISAKHSQDRSLIWALHQQDGCEYSQTTRVLDRQCRAECIQVLLASIWENIIWGGILGYAHQNMKHSVRGRYKFMRFTQIQGKIVSFQSKTDRKQSDIYWNPTKTGHQY